MQRAAAGLVPQGLERKNEKYFPWHVLHDRAELLRRLVHGPENKSHEHDPHRQQGRQNPLADLPRARTWPPAKFSEAGQGLRDGAHERVRSSATATADKNKLFHLHRRRGLWFDLADHDRGRTATHKYFPTHRHFLSSKRQQLVVLAA